MSYIHTYMYNNKSSTGKNLGDTCIVDCGLCIYDVHVYIYTVQFIDQKKH